MPHLLIDMPSTSDELPPVLVSTTADRRIGGPYTAAAALARALVPLASAELVEAHDIELRAIAPDLNIAARRETLAAHIPRAERILVPAAQRTLRIANGFAEFVRDALRGPATMVVHDLDEADDADRELLEVLRRRLPGLLTILAGEQETPWEPPEGSVAARLGTFVWRSEDAKDHVFAVQWCVEHGCHAAAAELGRRGLALAEPEADPQTWWTLVHHVVIALGALDREDEAEAVLRVARSLTTDPVWHSTMAYATAMMMTRHHDPARRDVEGALGWVNIGIALCRLLPDRESRAVKLGFDLNGKALIESRLGRFDTALALVEEAIELADRDLPPDAQPIHRLVLLANRAQLRILRDEPEAALEDLNAVIAADPLYPDYYVDRGNLLVALGRPDEALADYETAMRVGPPFAEAYFNRSEVRYAAGDLEGALEDLDYALELDPGFLDARINRAGLRAAAGDHDGARADAEAGLAADPDDPYLLCTLGQTELAAGRHAEAQAALDRAVEVAPSLAQTWASRGQLAYDLGRFDDAIADLDQAISLSEDPGLLFNRAMALRAAGRENEAVRDLERARRLDPDDPDILGAM